MTNDFSSSSTPCDRARRLMTPQGHAILALLHTATLEHVLARAADAEAYTAAGFPRDLAEHYLASGAAAARVDLLTTAAASLAGGFDPREAHVGSVGPEPTRLMRVAYQARAGAYVDLCDALDDLAEGEEDAPPLPDRALAF